MKHRNQRSSQVISQETAENAVEKARQTNSQQNHNTNTSSSGTKTPAHRPKSPVHSSNRSSSSIKNNAEADRKSKVIKSVPILAYIVKEALCKEEELVGAMQIVSFRDGDYIFRQGATEKDIYFIEEGKVIITRKRLQGGHTPATTPHATTGVNHRQHRFLRHSNISEEQILTYREKEYFGEIAFLQHAVRNSNAVAEGNVTCMMLDEEMYRTLLAPIHNLLLYRYQLRFHHLLEKIRMFKEQLPSQRQYLIDHCTLENFEDGTFICKQGKVEDKFYIIAEGEVKIVSEEIAFDEGVGVESIRNDDNEEEQQQEEEKKKHPRPKGGNLSYHPSLRRIGTIYSRPSSSILTVVAEQGPSSLVGGSGAGGLQTIMNVLVVKNEYEGFGEMGLLGKPRTAHAIANGKVLCIVITRRAYVAACQMLNNLIDADAESLLALSFTEEWNLIKNSYKLHLSNPVVGHYLVTFIKKFKASYHQKFVGRTIYLDFLRRFHLDSSIGIDFDFIASRLDWNSPSRSLSILRSETRRILSLEQEKRSSEEMSFIGRMIEATTFLNKFEMPSTINKFKVARQLGKAMEFLNIRKDVYLFHQGKVESKAYLILRGKINIVSEDINTNMSFIKRHEIIATLSAGDSFGELTLFTTMQRSASAVAASDTDLMVLDRIYMKNLQATLPGVNIRHIMVERAEFLSKLNFFKSTDFGHCIRVAHDIQEQIYEPHHLFLQEPTHLRTLYIVKRGEIAVFHKRKLDPIQIQTRQKQQEEEQDESRTGGKNIINTTKPQYTHGLIRIATIGAQEFFGMAILNANIALNASAAGTKRITPSTLASASASAMNGAAVSNDAWSSDTLYSTVYMCTTRCQILELSERGWRRLDVNTLAKIRNTLIERNRYNLAHVASQNEKDVSYFHPEKPWKLIIPGENIANRLEEKHPTQLVQKIHTKEKEKQRQYCDLFCNSKVVFQSVSPPPIKKITPSPSNFSSFFLPSNNSHHPMKEEPPPPSSSSPVLFPNDDGFIKSSEEISQSFAAVTLKNAPSLTSATGTLNDTPSSSTTSTRISNYRPLNSPIAPLGSPNASKSRWNGRDLLTLSGSFMGSFMTVAVVKKKEEPIQEETIFSTEKSLIQNTTTCMTQVKENESDSSSFLSPNLSSDEAHVHQSTMDVNDIVTPNTTKKENEIRIDENTAMWRTTSQKPAITIRSI